MDQLTTTPLWQILIHPAITILGIMVTSMIAIRKFKHEIKEVLEDRKFKISQSILERTLNNMQTAYKNLMEIKKVLYSSKLIAGMGGTEREEKARLDYEKFIEQLDQIRSWYDENKFFLPRIIRDDYVRLIEGGKEYVMSSFYQGKVEESTEYWHTYLKLYENLEKKFDEFMKEYSVFESSELD